MLAFIAAAAAVRLCMYVCIYTYMQRLADVIERDMQRLVDCTVGSRFIGRRWMGAGTEALRQRATMMLT